MPRTVLMWPVSVSLSVPLARSQILTVRSAAPEANHWLPGSKASARTQPWWPEMTRCSFHGACQLGCGTLGGARRSATARDSDCASAAISCTRRNSSWLAPSATPAGARRSASASATAPTAAAAPPL